MKHGLLFLAFAATAAPAFAQDNKPVCVDASQNDRYNARPISQHEVLAGSPFGRDRKAAGLATTCMHIYRGSPVALCSITTCISSGDEVSVSTIDGHGQMCRVTGVRPATESYADAKLKL